MNGVATHCLAAILLLSLCSHATKTSASEQCAVPSNADVSSSPSFWCNINATITLTDDCAALVEELLELPWSPGNITRYIPKQETQTLTNIQAFMQRPNSSDTSITASRQSASTPTNDIYTLTHSPVPSPISLRLHYTVSPGVLVFEHCNGILDFPTVTPPPGFAVMVSKWAIGGLSVPTLLTTHVEFRLPRDSQYKYIDSPTKHPPEIPPSTLDTTTATVDTSITHTASLHTSNPALYIFFLRTQLVNGWSACPIARSCASESRQLEEQFDPGVSRKLVIGLSVCAVVLVVLGAGATGIVWWIKSGRGSESVAEPRSELPDSLRHFAYDTGDEAASPQWKSWTAVEAAAPSRGSAEEICAVDLSPRVRDTQ